MAFFTSAPIIQLEVKTMSDNFKVTNEIKEEFRNVMCSCMEGSQPQGRHVIYTSMESLPGAMIANTHMNLDEDHPLHQVLKEAGITYGDLALADKDPALGNGGLGRLTACIQEGCATQKIPFTVSTLCYRSGLFCQKLENGMQVETPDNWRSEDGTYFFEFPAPEKAKWVSFIHDGVHDGQYVWVEMVPSAIAQIGAGGGCSLTWVWKVGKIHAPYGMDLTNLKRIDEVLYINDRDIRLMQEYCVSSATVQTAVEECLRQGRPVEDLPKLFCLHINDTHAGLMIPELIRILRDEHHKTLEEAWAIAVELFVYTNHTVLPEALEEWEQWRMNNILPARLVIALQDVDRITRGQLDASPVSLCQQDKERMYIIHDGRVRMANLCIHAAYSVNGVAKLHTQILCDSLLAPFYRYAPRKFCNVTNAVGFRKFLGYSNPELTKLIGAFMDREDWINHPEDMAKLLPHVEEPWLQAQFTAVHAGRKAILADFIRHQRGIYIPEYFLFQVQVKRFHMYKRQLLNCLYILWLYRRIKENKNFDMVPTAFIFGGKSAADYFQAKEVIRLVLALEKLINNDPDVNGKLRVAMVENFNVTNAMPVYTAADVSVQISTAGKEASGTGNMKFMVNGGLTLGTLDGANVEIYEAVGDEGMFLFGLKEHQISAMKGIYRSRSFYEQDSQLREVVDMLTDGSLMTTFPALRHELLDGEYGKAADEFFVLADFRSYVDANRRVWERYRKPEEWAKQCLRNIALSGEFSSDRMVREYESKVWNRQ